MANEQKRYVIQAEISKLEYLTSEIPYSVFTYWKNLAIFPNEKEARTFLNERCYPSEKFRIADFDGGQQTAEVERKAVEDENKAD